jgi:hypothetical protein
MEYDPFFLELTVVVLNRALIAAEDGEIYAGKKPGPSNAIHAACQSVRMWSRGGGCDDSSDSHYEAGHPQACICIGF